MSSKTTDVIGEKREQNLGLMPRLRFQEFREAAEWKSKKLIEVTDRKTRWGFIGGPFGSNLKSSDYTDRGIRIIQLQNIGDAEFIDDYRIFTSEEKADELASNNIFPGDILMSKMGDPVGRACLVPDIHERYVMCSDGIRLVVDQTSHCRYFIYSLINSPLFRSLVEKTATGSTRKRIGLDELKNLSLLVPERDEQQKIADCLSSVDELIAAQARKLDAIGNQKKGLMQLLLPAEGETVPRLRFPEFQDAGEWVERTLGELLLQGPDYGLNAAAVPYSPSLPTFLRITDISDDGIFLSACRVSVNTVPPSEYFLKTGDIVLARTGASVGKSYRYLEDDGSLVFAGYLIRITPDPTKVSPALLASIFYSDGYWNWVDINSARSGQPGINATEYASFPVMIPAQSQGRGLQEQQKIAECLSSMDDAITQLRLEIEELKMQKNGLMQQLFPVIDEVEA